MVASISHELRTLLAVVRAHLETLGLQRPVMAGTAAAPKGEIPVPAATMSALVRGTERLASLIDDLFALSRADVGKAQIDRAPVDVAAGARAP